MIEINHFLKLLARYTKKPNIDNDDILFGSGLNLSSIGFTEFIMELEEDYNIDIDVSSLDASIKTVEQLFDRLSTT